eukprot:2379743-Pleurochrysis_carterae.AAC.4
MITLVNYVHSPQKYSFNLTTYPRNPCHASTLDAHATNQVTCALTPRRNKFTFCHLLDSSRPPFHAGLATSSPPAPAATPPAPYYAPQTAPPSMANENIDANDDASATLSPPQFEEATEEETMHEQLDTNDEGTIAERLLRRRRQTAPVVASDLLITPTKPFVINLCSGAQRDGDLAEFLVAGGLQVVHVDFARG